MTAPRRPRHLVAALALLALVGALVGAGATRATPGAELAQTGRLTYLPQIMKGQAETIPPATVAADLTIRPVPLKEVQRGEDLAVEYRFRNDGRAPLTARFSLFYPQRLINFEWLDASGDQYIGHDATRVIVEVRNVAPGATRTGRINFIVFSDAGVGSRIGLYADYECRTGATCQSNFAEVEVLANDSGGGSGGTFTMAVSPDRGPPGTAHTFSGARFRPGETYVTWLNTPSGVQPLPITGRADGAGRIQFTFGSGQLTQAGFYSMVAHGQQSGVENVGPFIVQINGQPADLSLLAGAAAPLAAGPALAAEPEPAQAAGSGGIAGRITGAGAGLAGVTVEVTDSAGRLVAVTRSRAGGNYLVPTGLATGQYSVTAKPGLDPALALYAKATAGPVSVTSPDLAANVNLALPAAGGLRGAVTAGGAPAPGVRVSAIGPGGVAGADLTDSTGTYSITNLPAGSYTLRFDPRAAGRAAFYSLDTRDGQVVTAGQVASLPAYELASARTAPTTGVIAGRVTDAATGAGLPDVLVVITGAGGDPSLTDTYVSVAETEADGSYVSDQLRPGDYRVQFVTLFSDVPSTTRYSGEFYNDAPTFAESDPITVGAGGAATADAALARGGSIAGVVSGDGAGPLAEVVVIARDGAGVPRGFARTDANGAYTLGGLRAGTYSLSFSTGFSPNSASRAFFDGGLAGVSVGAGAAVTGQSITLNRGAQIVGTVSAGDTGVPLAGVRVVFFRAEGATFSVVGIGQTDAAGAYSSPALASGSYRMLFTTAFSPNAATRTYQGEFFNNRGSLGEADAVIVPRFLGAVTRNLDLAPGGAVAGRVTAADTGAGLAGVIVVARAGGVPVGGTVSDEAGLYTLEGLPAGQVELSFTTAFSPDLGARAYPTGLTTADVTTGATTTEDVALPPAP
ncbi:MAG TPA: carboxypeptidase regulatory-like domain-containing protein [Chloroflexaceae bacterium]|nr:carboxypeptidase regulatory-like domain-containing protein [Chloroflexaceae bacterium]